MTTALALAIALGLLLFCAIFYFNRSRAPRTFVARILEKGSDGTERPVVIGPASSTALDAADGAWARYERLCGVAVTESGARARPDRDARCVVREIT